MTIKYCPKCNATMKMIDIILAGSPLRGKYRQAFFKCSCSEDTYTAYIEV
jgi:hypothetical protein